MVMLERVSNFITAAITEEIKLYVIKYKQKSILAKNKEFFAADFNLGC